VKRCAALWNGHAGDRARFLEAIYATDVGGTPAGLVKTTRDGRCEVLIGAVGSRYVDGAFVYSGVRCTAAEKKSGACAATPGGVYRAVKALEGNDGRAKPPPWNAKVNDDATIRLGQP
jgi:hypothetical protein